MPSKKKQYGGTLSQCHFTHSSPSPFKVENKTNFGGSRPPLFLKNQVNLLYFVRFSKIYGFQDFPSHIDHFLFTSLFKKEKRNKNLTSSPPQKIFLVKRYSKQGNFTFFVPSPPLLGTMPLNMYSFYWKASLIQSLSWNHDKFFSLIFFARLQVA